MNPSTSRWSVVAAFALVGASTQMVWLTLAPVTTVAAERFGVSDTAIGWLANIFVLAFVVLAIPAGMVLDRLFRPALALGGLLTAAGACLRLAGDSYEWLLIGGIVAALGQPIMLTGITGLARNYLAPHDRATGIAIATASTWAGFIAAFGLAAIFADESQLRTLLTVHAVYALVAALVLLLALRAPAPFADSDDATPMSLADVKRTWSDPFVRGLCFFGFIPFGTFIALTTWAETLLEPAGVSPEMVGIILISQVVAGVVGTVVLPVWASRHRKEVLMGAVGIGLTSVACFLLATAPSAAMALVTMTIIGFLMLPMLAIVLGILERHAGEDEGVASGIVWTFGNLGGLVVTGIIGFTTGSPGLSFAILGVVTLLALPVLRTLVAPVAALAEADNG